MASFAAVAAPGFWGVPTSSVDWCEANYALSAYVCEFFNTCSSVVLIVVGLAGAYLHRRVLERRFALVFLSVVVVGVGSVAFHGTLLFELQMLDELPMLYTAALLVYILLEDRPKPRHGPWLPAVLVIYAAFATYGAAFTRGGAQFWFFQISFASLEVLGLILTTLLYRKSREPAQRRLFRAGMTLYLLAIALWFVDLRFCDALVGALGALGLPNIQLHAWWHALVACGLYALILMIGHHRMNVLGQRPRLVRRAGIPRLVAAE